MIKNLTNRKAIDQVRKERRQVPANITIQSDCAISSKEESDEAVLMQLVGQEHTPELAALLAERCEILLGQLRDEKMRRIALWKFEGYTNGEIARKLSCSRRTFIRKLEAIRLIWGKETES